MAKIQRLKISTDEKMSMLRGQPGHMPAAPAAAEPVAPAPETAPAGATPGPGRRQHPRQRRFPPGPGRPPAARAARWRARAGRPAQAAPVAATPKKGRGRPRKAAPPEAAEATSGGLQPSLIRLEGETQRAALAYIHEELMNHSRRVYLKELVDEAVNFYLQHGPPAKDK